DAPDGYAAEAGDCDDTDATVSPGAAEACDGEDDDCDGATDEDAVDARDWHADADADGYGNPAVTAPGCSAPAGYVADATDCDDTRATTRPSASETCNERDDDCDGATDEGVTTTFYADLDGDGAGGAGFATDACSAPGGFVAGATDCDDGDASTHPGAAETCDEADDDCDGTVDEGVTTTFYADADGDGHGALGSPRAACATPAGYAATALDCDDGAAAIHPGALETCNGVDDDCDGAVDPDDAEGAPSWHTDADGDGYGLDAGAVRACEAPAGTVASGGDCDDDDPAVSPGAEEVWYDGVDQDCAGDDDADQDGDGFAAEAADGEDCDDTDPDVSPDAA
ncbi:MAG: putative metal-binding motif-containing protein, partial [Myxococcota bacterium]